MINKTRNFIICFMFYAYGVIAQAEEVIKVGWIGPISGEAAILGVDSAKVAQQVFDEVNKQGGINGQKIEFIAEDDQYQTAKTVTAYNKLVNVDGVKIVFVITYGGVIAVAAQAQRDNVILIDTLDCDEELAGLPDNIFCVAKKSEDLGIQNALSAIRRGHLPVAIIYAEGDPFFPKVAKASKDTLESNGGSAVVYQGMVAPFRDFRAVLLQAKAKKVNSLFVYGYDYFGLILKQAKEINLNVPVYSVPMVHSPGFIATAQGAEVGTYVAGWFAPKTEDYTAFLLGYKSKVGREPYLEVSTVPTYDMAKVLVNGLKTSTNRTTGELDLGLLKGYLYGVKNYQGLSGTVTIDPDGAVRSFKVGNYQYLQGKYQDAK